MVKNAGYEMLQQNKGDDVIAALVGKGAVDCSPPRWPRGSSNGPTQQVDNGAKSVQMPGAAVAGAIVLLHHSGDTAWTNFRDSKGQQWDVRMARENGHWRITEVKNVEQLLQRFQQERGIGNPAMPPGMGAPGAAAPPAGSAPEAAPPADRMRHVDFALAVRAAQTDERRIIASAITRQTIGTASMRADAMIVELTR